MKFTFTSNSKEQTRKLGAIIAPLFVPSDVVLLKGDLGAGKTTLVGGVAEALKVNEDVISPTFNIMKCYFKGTLPLYHIDAYRLEGQNIELGLEEFIEDLVISLSHKGGDAREISVESNCPRLDKIVEAVKEAF